jgi:hypothetical protein
MPTTTTTTNEGADVNADIGTNVDHPGAAADKSADKPAANTADGTVAGQTETKVESLLNASAEAGAEKGVEGDGADKKDGVEKSEATNPVTAEDLTIPEGRSYDPEIGKSFLGIINDPAIPRSELAQKLLDLQSAYEEKMFAGQRAAEEAQTKAQNEQWERENAEWLELCKKDPEFGGQNYEASKAVITRGCTHLATKEAVDALNALNMGTHPEIVRMFYRAGKLLGEDPGVKAGTAGRGTLAKGEGLTEMYRKVLEGE